LSTLLASGMPLVEALGTVEQAVSATPFEKKIYQTKEDIITGKSFAASLKTHSVLPKTGLKLIEVGEASGSLEKMLTEVSEYYQERFQDSITRMMTYLEPLLMLAVGLIIGSIILIMYLPIFYIAEVVK
ncbi:MAG: type II secretion system F family protein, partial [Candidatus Bathyarchaeota archaeon]|nr:type II secretion system F family protein [Candidatus Bathyarchaeota archaeon]